jgi:hypothetical protein
MTPTTAITTIQAVNAANAHRPLRTGGNPVGKR